jgi:5S rRNA maturation endonuclease (ribonuclease M5)
MPKNVLFKYGVPFFNVQHEALKVVQRLKRRRLKGTCWKLYLWLCSSFTCPEIEANAEDIMKAIGVGSRNTIQSAREELTRLNLIKSQKRGGTGAYHIYGIRNIKAEGLFQASEPGGSAYFQMPRSFVFSRLFNNDSGTLSLFYSSALAKVNLEGVPSFRVEKKGLPKLGGLSPNSTKQVLRSLTSGRLPFLQYKDNQLAVLNPDNAQQMAEGTTDGEEFYFLESNSGRYVKVQELLTGENFSRYFKGEFPELDLSSSQQNVNCKFHDDQKPSCSLNLDQGTWHCHTCNIGGGILDFEGRLMGIEFTEGSVPEDKRPAWKRIAKKLGVRLKPVQRGEEVSRHSYYDEQGEYLYELRRYADGSGAYFTRDMNGKSRAGLKGKKQKLYNLPELKSAETVILTEGEKKADAVSLLPLCDQNGRPIAVTTSGSAASWRPEFVQELVGKRVLIFSDSDEAGQRYASHVSASLDRSGIEHEVVDFTGYGKDVRDLLKSYPIDQAEGLVKHVDSPWLRIGKAERRTEVLQGSLVDI